MTDYELYYWDLPFRGNFIHLLLEVMWEKNTYDEKNIRFNPETR